MLNLKVSTLPRIFASTPRRIHKHFLVYDLQSNSRMDYFSRQLKSRGLFFYNPTNYFMKLIKKETFEVIAGFLSLYFNPN